MVIRTILTRGTASRHSPPAALPDRRINRAFLEDKMLYCEVNKKHKTHLFKVKQGWEDSGPEWIISDVSGEENKGVR